MEEYYTHVCIFRGDKMGATIVFESTLDLLDIKDDVNGAAKDACMDIINDVQFVTKGSAPHLTGNLERSISKHTRRTKHTFTGEISISAYSKRGYDYGALRHDFHFNLGEGSLNKPPVVSSITGEMFEVGSLFAKTPIEGNTNGYLEFLEDKISKAMT